MSKSILVITGDGGESYEALCAVHRLREAGYEPRIAAPSRKRLNLVMHDFEPGWDTYIERPGRGGARCRRTSPRLLREERRRFF
jgi:protease I